MSMLFTVALVGNPNTGKSTLFSALAGVHQRVGNYPGVTVEKKTGRMDHAGRRYELVDLPGLYSLAARSLDELVAVDVLAGHDAAPPDLVLAIVDASNLGRNLYLLSQVLELGLPTVVALNMQDLAERQGVRIDAARLEERLGVPVVAVQAHRRIGLAALKAAMGRTLDQSTERSPPTAAPEPPARPSPLPTLLVDEAERLAVTGGFPSGRRGRFLAERLILDSGGFLERSLLAAAPGLQAELAAARERLQAAGLRLPGVETDVRHAWAADVERTAAERFAPARPGAGDRIDRVLTHRVWGLLVLLAVMAALFQAVFAWATPLVDLIDGGVSAVGGWAEQAIPPGALQSLIVDGVIGGVGGVLVFLPQIAILFAFIAVLEDCGYMARGAYLADRLMSRIGLSGKSFVPMLSSFACAIPGIMAARVIENQRDRLATILVAPLLTCSARLPVYALLIAAFIPNRSYAGGLLNLQGLTLSALYLLGIVAAVLMALLLKRTLLRGESPLFFMELPSYKWPSPRTILYRILERCLIFVRTAGTLILAVSILVWAAAYYPQHSPAVARLAAQRDAQAARLAAAAEDQRPLLQAELSGLDAQIELQRQRDSFLGRAGSILEPVVRPLGWDWRVGCAVVASFPAREVVVATLGVLFNPLADEEAASEEEGATQLQAALKAARWEGSDRPLFTMSVALSLMVFFALCAQCAATLAVIRRETNSWRWPAFAFGYMTALAYLGALATYQLASRWGW